MKTINIPISDTKSLSFDVDDCTLRNATLPFLVATLGEPRYIITDGDVGEPRREIVVEPQPISVPVPETVPQTPVPA